MHLKTLAFILIAAIAICAQAQERTVVATVDSTPIYLDEIGGGNSPQQGEIKFVDPQGAPQGADIENQIILLRKRIKDELLRSEIQNRSISPPEDLVTKEVNAYADRQWQLLFPTPEKKKEVLSRMQLTGLKILEGLNIWIDDEAKGNEFAKKELEPLGMNEQAWSFYTKHAGDPEILEKLEKWEEIDEMSEEEIKEFLFLTKNKDHRENIKFILAKEILINDLTSQSQTSPEETKRLFDLINNTKWIDIIIIPEGNKELTKLSGVPKNERKSLLSDKLKSKKMRLPRTDNGNSRRNHSSLKEYMFLASYADSIEPGTLSSIIDLTDQGQDTKNFAIYIMDRQTRSQVIEADANQKRELTKALQKFKRDREFLNWLSEEIPKRTKILLSEYKEALTP